MSKVAEALEVDNALIRKAIHTGQSNIAQNGKVQNQTLTLAVFGNEADARLDSILRLVDGNSLSL